MKRRKHAPDFVLLVTTLLLLAIGIVMVYSASEYVSRNTTRTAENPEGYNYYVVRRQLVWVAIGLVVMFIGSKLNYWHLAHLAKFGYLATVIMLIMVKIPGIGVTRYGATRWLGFEPFIFQPSEIAKLSLSLFLARWLAIRGDRIESFVQGILPPLLFTGTICGLIMLQPDLGTTILIFAIAAVLVFVTGAQWKHIISLALTSVLGIIGLIYVEKYRLERWLSFRNPWADPLDTGHQLIQSFYALGPGGLFGRGLAQSIQKRFYLPFPHTDFILAVIGEELGFAGVSVVVLLYGIFVWRGLKIALNASDTFGTLLATALTATVGLQAIINIAVVTGSIPTTGIPLPLISAGGSSLIFTLGSIGVLLNISKYSRE
ncbi:MAG TPA: putative lipid II flippase FtsW [Firmicutes bacterium]|jgi:cell division protein FtsW|nr:putative lipid II flippase FtsW [Bacillota bacterium]